MHNTFYIVRHKPWNESNMFRPGWYPFGPSELSFKKWMSIKCVYQIYNRKSLRELFVGYLEKDQSRNIPRPTAVSDTKVPEFSIASSVLAN